MGRNEAEILNDEIAALAAMGDGSRMLNRLVARVLKRNVGEVRLSIPLPAAEALGQVTGILKDVGRVLDPEDVEPRPGWTNVRAVVGGGVGQLNPVVVTVSVSTTGATATDVELRAAALEGLVRQHAGERTAERLAAALSA